jgi:hypothetical protein
MLIGLLIRKGSVLKAKLRMVKRLGKARAVTYTLLIYLIYTLSSSFKSLYL